MKTHMRNLLAVFVSGVLGAWVGASAGEGRLALGVDTNAAVELNDGTQYQLQRVTRRDADAVTFKHATGISRVRFSEMTPATRALFGIAQPLTRSQVATLVPIVPQDAPKIDTIVIQKAGPPAPSACASCRGSRTIVCPGCHGMKFSDDKIVPKPCDNCDGTGRIARTYSYSYGGGPGAKKKMYSTTSHPPCPQCNGSGKMETTGRGYCAQCGGTGVTACQHCIR